MMEADAYPFGTGKTTISKSLLSRLKIAKTATLKTNYINGVFTMEDQERTIMVRCFCGEHLRKACHDYAHPVTIVNNSMESKPSSNFIGKKRS